MTAPTLATQAWRDGRLVELTPEEQAALQAESDANHAAQEAADAQRRALAYRDARRTAYLAALSEGRPTVEEALGDMLDDLATEVAALRAAVGGTMTAGLAAKLQAVASIKAANPKPQE